MRRPHFIAEQARSATGLLGRIIAFIMAHFIQHYTTGDELRDRAGFLALREVSERLL